jgi:putative transposase
MRNKRNRTPSEHIGHGLYLYFLGLSLRSVVRALSFLHIVKRSHVAVWQWIQKYKPRRKMVSRKRDDPEHVVDETLVKTGSELVWIWVAIGSKSRLILAPHISKERSMLIAEKFLSGLVGIHGKCPVSTDGGTWYPQACKFLKLTHRIHSSHEKSLIERTMQYIKDRTECFDDYFPCRKARCNLHHIKNWLNLFATMHNKKAINA